MTMQMTGSGQAFSIKIREAAQSGKYPEAFGYLQELSVLDGLISCLDLAETNLAAFNALAAQATSKGKPQFVVRLVKDGHIPQDAYAGIGADIEYHFSRIFILKARVEKKNLVNALWPKAEGIAKSKPFYPEMIRSQSGRRDRICAVAEKHVNLGPFDGRQVALFSLGGLYDFSAAKAGTKPQKGATTCILFARGVLHAAGCNVIGTNTIRSGSIVTGLFSELPKSAFGYVPASEYDKGKRPQRGDIFHIRGGNFKNKDGNDTGIDSTHVGIIVDTVGDTWMTIEGGGGDNVTRRNQRKLVGSSSSHGKWAFHNDNTSAGVRPLQGWYSIDAINSGQWMA
ncbi:MAG: hypothetical protein AB1631_11885 [Acidobacteriota bacterium]